MTSCLELEMQDERTVESYSHSTALCTRPIYLASLVRKLLGLPLMRRETGELSCSLRHAPQHRALAIVVSGAGVCPAEPALMRSGNGGDV